MEKDRMHHGCIWINAQSCLSVLNMYAKQSFFGSFSLLCSGNIMKFRGGNSIYGF